MSLKPMSRYTMLNLKTIRDEEIRKNHIEVHIKHIYNKTVQYAELQNGTFYHYKIPSQYDKITGLYTPDSFYIQNINDIILRLQDLFPECKVEYVTYMSQNMKLVKNIIPNNNKRLRESYIIIDWS